MESISDKSILLAALNDSYKEDIRKYEVRSSFNMNIVYDQMNL